MNTTKTIYTQHPGSGTPPCPPLTHTHTCIHTSPAHGLRKETNVGRRKNKPYRDCLHPYRPKQWQGSPAQDVSDWNLPDICLFFSWPILSVIVFDFFPPRWQTVKAGVWQKDGRRCQRWNEWRGGKKEREKTSGCRLNRGPLKNEGGGISEVSDRDVRDWPLRFSLLLHPQLLRLHSH